MKCVCYAWNMWGIERSFHWPWGVETRVTAFLLPFFWKWKNFPLLLLYTGELNAARLDITRTWAFASPTSCTMQRRRRIWASFFFQAGLVWIVTSGKHCTSSVPFKCMHSILWLSLFTAMIIILNSVRNNSASDDARIAMLLNAVEGMVWSTSKTGSKILLYFTIAKVI